MSVPAETGPATAVVGIESQAIDPAPADSEPAAPEDVAEARPATKRLSQSVAIWGIFFMLALVLLYFAKPVLMPIALALVLSTALTPLVSRLNRWHVPQGIAAAVVMLAAIALPVLAVQFLVLPAWDILRELPQPLLDVIAKFQVWLKSLRVGTLADARGAAELTKEATSSGLKVTGTFLWSLLQGITIALIAAIVLSYFMLASGNLYLAKLVRVIPKLRDKVDAVRIVREVQSELATYLTTVFWINLGLGTAVALLAWAFKIPAPLFWGAAIALLNFIPYFGPAIGMCLLSLAALAFLDSPVAGFSFVLAFIGIVFIEGQFINPLLVGRRLALNPLAVFIALLFWGWMWGGGGLLLAVPLLIVAKKFADRFPGWEPVSEFLSR